MNQPSPDEHQIDRREAEEHLAKHALLPRMNESFPGYHFGCLPSPNCRHQSISHQHTNHDHHAETKAEKPSKNCEENTFHSGEKKLPQLSIANAGKITLAAVPNKIVAILTPAVFRTAEKSLGRGDTARSTKISAQGLAQSA